jgi:flavodoxin
MTIVRRIISFVFALTIAVVFMGIGESKVSALSAQTESTSEPKVLVVYFSRTGNTKNIAQFAADSLGVRICEIVPTVPYTAEDINYNNSSSRATLEQKDTSVRPAITGSISNMDKYDIILLGYPIWFGQAPRIISTFLESYDFSGKTIVPFCTSQSSGIGSSATNLHSLCSSTAKWLSGSRFSSKTTKAEVATWINGLNLGITADANRTRNIISSGCAEVEEGVTSTINVTTLGVVNKIQLVGTDGGTTTVAAYTQNEDSTRTWSIDKSKLAGTYEYGIKIKVGSTWVDEGDMLNVKVNAKAVESGKVVDVQYTPSTSTKNTFMVKVEGRAAKIQFIEENSGTRTYDRYNSSVKGIKSYDAQGNEVSDTARTLSYEIWEVEANLPVMTHQVIGKFGTAWNTADPYNLTITLAA